MMDTIVVEKAKNGYIIKPQGGTGIVNGLDGVRVAESFEKLMELLKESFKPEKGNP